MNEFVTNLISRDDRPGPRAPLQPGTGGRGLQSLRETAEALASPGLGSRAFPLLSFSLLCIILHALVQSDKKTSSSAFYNRAQKNQGPELPRAVDYVDNTGGVAGRGGTRL